MTTAEHFTRLENMMHAAPFMQEIARASGIFVRGKTLLSPEIGYK